jgi:hypothetical protein
MITWRGGLEDGVLEFRSTSDAPVVVVRDLDQACSLIAAGGLSEGVLTALIAHAAFLHALATACATTAERPGGDLAVPLKIASERLTVAAAKVGASVAAAQALTRQHICCEGHQGQLSARELCARLLMEARRIQREAATP